MVLHPPHKLTYFKKAHWESEWIQTAESLVRNELERPYTSQASEQVLGSGSANSDVEVPRKPASYNPSFSIFDNIDGFMPPKAADLCNKIDHYLAAGVKQVADDLVKW